MATVIGHYSLKYYFSLETQRPLDSDHKVSTGISQPQQPSSTLPIIEQDSPQVPRPTNHPKLASVENTHSGSEPALVFRCPSNSEEDTEDEEETPKHSIQACSRIFKEMRNQDEAIKAANVMLKMKQRRMEREAKTWDSKTTRVSQKVILITAEPLRMKWKHCQARAKISAEKQAKEMEIRLRGITNGTEVARLQLLCNKATSELNSVYGQVANLQTGARVDKVRIQTLENELERARVDKADTLDRSLTLETTFAQDSKASEAKRLESERALEDRYGKEIEKQSRLQEVSKKELKKVQQELHAVKSEAAMEKKTLSEDVDSMNKRLADQLCEVTRDLETTKNKAESLQSQLDRKEAEEADTSKKLLEQAKQLEAAKSTAESLRSELDRKEAEEADASRQLKEQAVLLREANGRVTSLQSQLDKETSNDDEMVDATHICDHTLCQKRFNELTAEAAKHQKRVEELEANIGRLGKSHGDKTITFRNQLQNAKQIRDAALASATAAKKEKKDLEDILEQRDCEVQAGIADRARLEHTILGQKDIVKATCNVQTSSQSGGDNLSTTKVGGGRRRKREEDEEYGEPSGSETHAQRVETVGPTAKHIKGPEPKAMVEAPVEKPSRDLLQGKFGREVANQIEQWFGIMGEAKRPGKFSLALQTWMKFLMEDFDELQNACQTVALHLSMITVVNLQDHGLMLFAHHIKDFVQYCLQTGIWSPEKQGKMKSVEKYAQMILNYGVEAGAEFRDCKDPTTFYHGR